MEILEKFICEYYKKLKMESSNNINSFINKITNYFIIKIIFIIFTINFLFSLIISIDIIIINSSFIIKI